jgi:ribonuclease P protein component
VVVHHRPQLGAHPALVGLVVGKTVGGSVVRHRVSRRLRAQLRERLDRLPAGSGTVVRALPESATATSAQLGRSLDRAFERLAARR